MLKSGSMILGSAIIAAAAALSACAHTPLSIQDQAEIYRDALAQASDAVFGPPPHQVLVFDPRLLPEPITTGPVRPASGAVVDPRIVRLLRAMVCEPSTRNDECANGVRGLAARPSAIHPQGAHRATLSLVVNAVQAAGDNTVLVHLNRQLHYEAVWKDSHWSVRPAPGGTRT